MHYDVEEHKWKELGRFNAFPYSPPFLVTAGSLFATGGIYKHAFWLIDMEDDPKNEYAGIKRVDFNCVEEHNFHQYDGKE